MIRLSLARVAIFCAAASAFGVAAAGVQLSHFPPHPGVMPGGGFDFKSNSTFANPTGPRAWVNGTYGGVPGAKVTQPVAVNGPGGPMTVQVGRSATNAAIGKAAAALLKGLPFVAVGVAAWDFWDENYRVRPDGAGGLLEDPGTAPVPRTVVNAWTFNPPYRIETSGGSAQQACSNLAAAYPGGFSAADPTQYIQSMGTISGSATVCYASQVVQRRISDNSITFQGGTVFGSVGQPVTASICPASIDASNPAYSIPEGAPVGPDGKCPTARYNHSPITEDAAAEKFRLAPPADVGEWAEKAIEGGKEIAGEPAGISGPASQQGAPTTTTTVNPDSTTTTTTKTPTHTFNYGGDSFTWNTTTVTVVNNNGQVTTTTEEAPGAPVEQAEAVPPSDPSMPELPVLYEKKYPDGLAGVWATRSVEIQQTPMFAFLGSLVPSTGDGGCPVWSLPVNVLGISASGEAVTVPCYVWSFIRLVIIISALLLSRRLIFGG